MARAIAKKSVTKKPAIPAVLAREAKAAHAARVARLAKRGREAIARIKDSPRST